MSRPGPGSRLPEDPAYWEELASRSIDAAFRSAAPAQLRSAARGAGGVYPWWHSLADSAFVLAATAVLALIGGPLLVGERSPRVTAETDVLADVLAPRDALLRSLLESPSEPTSASALLKLIALREEER